MSNLQVEKANPNSLLEFEQALERNDFASAEKSLMEILLHLNVHRAFSKTSKDGFNILPFTPDDSDETNLKHYQLVVDRIILLFINPDYEMSEFGFQVFNIFKSQLMWLFIAAGRDNLDIILYEKNIAHPDNTEMNLSSEQDLKLLLTCFTIESDLSLDFSLLYQNFPDRTGYCYVGCFYYSNIVLSERSESTLRDLIAYSYIFEKLPMNNDLMVLCSNIWMTCTYINCNEKHNIKQAINKYYQRYLTETLSKTTKHRIKKYLLKYKKNTKEKKKLVICSEVLSEGHAMTRCYIEPMIYLSRYFDTVLIGSSGLIDKNYKEHFSKIIEVDDKIFGHHDSIVNSILNEEPDIIWYPSLGMACWTLPLCNLRLAPVQVMSLGHPASSMSKSIDYCISDKEVAKFMTESIESNYTIDIQNVYTPRHYELINIKDEIKADEIHIAINSKDFKVRSVFIDLCQQLNNASSKKCIFHFFPNAHGLMRDAFKENLNGKLDHYEIHKVNDYQTYMNELAKCDMTLSTFPFGGSNSNVDAFLLGLPRVILIGEGPEASADLTQATVVNLPNWLITESVEQYFLSALALIENDELRKEVSETIIATNPKAILFNEDAACDDKAYPDAFYDMYESNRYDPKKKYNRAICY